MTSLPTGVDAEVLADVRAVEEARRLLAGRGKALPFWETLCLVKVDGPLLRGDVAKLRDDRNAGLAPAVVEKLALIRERVGPLVNNLRKFLALVPQPPEGEELEMILGFVAISPKGREAASRWLADPAKHLKEATEKIRIIASIVDGYRRAIRPPAPSPPPATPAPPPAASKGPAELPSGVDPDVLEDVRRVEECRKVFEITHQQIEVWEIFCLVVADRDTTKTALEGLLRLRNAGETERFTEGALALFEKLLNIRSQHGRFVRELRTYVGALPVGHFGKDTMEMAMGFIVASTRGRERARQWLAEPERHRVEAAGRLEDIISRALKYQTALRMLP